MITELSPTEVAAVNGGNIFISLANIADTFNIPFASGDPFRLPVPSFNMVFPPLTTLIATLLAL